MSGGLIFIVVFGSIIYIMFAEAWGGYWVKENKNRYGEYAMSVEWWIGIFGVIFPLLPLSFLLWLFIYLPMKISGLK